jgi:membrane-bound ClpP family serine protease
LFISDDMAAIALTIAVVWVLYSHGSIGAEAAIVIGVLAAAFFSFVAFKTYALQAMKPKVGAEVMVGKVGKAVSDLDPEGEVEIEGEYWKAVGGRPIGKGAAVRVVRVDGLKVTVAPAEG